ncbi:zinc finger protein 704-like isoform X2 [Babylonia areolata]|uniref:zinc finger protein 704-like isoform X2 n=1 Tax=Babylonia areolata TaxID=304850 RepID=UPI003FD3EEE3
MSGTKRLAKRSILGTRVSALWQQDGRYYPGVIRAQATEETPSSKALYTVHFDDGFEANVTGKDIIGQGFQTGPSGRLKHGQKVFVTMNGREVCGVVAHHDRRIDEVIISLKQSNGEEFTINRKVDEVRLMESRKSARLVDLSTDYSKLADVQLSEPKRRAVSHNIDVPSPAFKQRPRRHRDSSGDTEGGSENGGDFDDVDMMDETIAAMVLTSLSVSPKSPPFSNTQFQQSRVATDPVFEPSQEHSYVSSSIASSGFYSGHSEHDDPSPPHAHLSESAPAAFDLHRHEDPGGVLLSPAGYSAQGDEGVKYRCTWRGCLTVCGSCNDIERHIRRAHFDRDSDLELSDKEEEFYYEELDDDELDSVTQSFADMYTSSPPSVLPEPQDATRTFDHDYQRKGEKVRVHTHQSQASSVPSGGSFGFSGTTTTTTSIPITIPEGQIKRSLSWQIQGPSPGSLVSPPQRSSKMTPQERLQQHQAQSPKSHMLSMSPLKSSAAGPHRKPRSEVRKCRKVYGMDNRDQWCTQCKWKKACTRFWTEGFLGFF